ncbi:MAG: CoA transferase [Betaproteobacteria bacterium]|nr:MAG: CoA transferase [Betaproteobacteria bacterium]
MAGIGPAPFCAMMLADMGAEVIRVDRTHRANDVEFLSKGRQGATLRGRRTLALDLKQAGATDALLGIIEHADALIEGFRPGVMERLGLGPEICLQRNPRLVYGRVTGWGQDGPLAQAPGHDINYIAITGALSCIGRAGEAPVPPLNLVGDFGGGGMLLAFGIVCALLEARSSGRGQIIDAAMVDGAALLMANIFSRKAAGVWTNERGKNALDGGAHWYGVYECADGKYVSIGAIEPQFYSALLEKCGIDDPALRSQWQREEWPALREKLARIFLTRTRAEWCALLEGSDACFAPVLDLDEAAGHAQNRARSTFVETDGAVEPAPAPRFSRTAPEARESHPLFEAEGEAMLGRWGVDSQRIQALRRAGE